MARRPSHAVRDREVAELRLLNALTANYSDWAQTAVRDVLTALPESIEAFLAQTYQDRVVTPTLQAAVAQGFEAKAREYLSRYSPVADVAEVARSVRDYAVEKGLTKRATRNLLRDALAPDARVLERIPDELLKMTGRGAPRLIRQGFPFAERGLTYRDRLATSARTLSTGMDGWAARREAAVSGDELRWVTMQDDRVRPAHRHAQGQTVGYDEPFMVGGYPMWFPGDPDAPEDLTVNCRCVLAAIAQPNRLVQRYIPSEWLAAAASFNPGQARAPKGSPGGIGGQWIDTPVAMLRALNRLGPGVDVAETDPTRLILDQVADQRRKMADGILAREGRPGVEETAARVLDIYKRTTPEQREAGARWYDEARDVARGMVAESGGKMTEEQAAAVIAHLSTRTRWDVNVIAAQTMARGGTMEDANAAIKAAGLTRGGVVMKANWERAAQAAASADPIGRDNLSLGTFSEAANKTRTFASNIMGDKDGVCIDTWMYRVVGQEPLLSGTIPGTNQAVRKDQVYEAIAETVRVAADQVGVPPAELQAATWLWTLANYHPSRAGRPGYIIDPATGDEIPDKIGGPLVTTGSVTVDTDPRIDDDEPLDYFYVQAEKAGVSRLGMPDPRSIADARAEWLRVMDALTAAGFRPSQARIPAKQRGAGRWTVTATGVKDFLALAKDFPTYGKPFDPDQPYIKQDAWPSVTDLFLQTETEFATARLGEDTVHDQVNSYLRNGGEADTGVRTGGPLAAQNRDTGVEMTQGASWFEYDEDVEALVAGHPIPDEAVPSMVQAIDFGMTFNTTTEPTMLYRGIATEYADTEWAVGSRFVERGYSSASARPDVAANFAAFRSGQPSAFDNSGEVIRDAERGGTPTVLEIALAPGVHFAYGAPMVSEVLLERKMVYEVTGVQTAPVSMGDGTTQMMQTVQVAAYPMDALGWESTPYKQETLFDIPEEQVAA